MRRKEYREERRRLEQRVAEGIWQRNLNRKYLSCFAAEERGGRGSLLLNEAKAEAQEDLVAAQRRIDQSKEALAALREAYRGERKERLLAIGRAAGRLGKRTLPLAPYATTLLLAGIALHQHTHPRIIERTIRYESVPVVNADVPEGVKEHLREAGLTSDTFYVVDKKMEESVIYQVEFRAVKRTEVSTGTNPGDKRRGGDHRTPETRPGEFFYITSVEPSQGWIDPFDGRKGAYGPYFLRFDTIDRRLATWGNGKSPFGYHGTLDEALIGTPASHGCVRHRNFDIKDMVKERYLKVGTPTIIGDGILSGRPTLVAGGAYGAR